MADPAFLFTDLVGFTAFTEREGDEAAADLAERFCERVDELNDGHGARDVKTLGDGCMIHVPDPRCAAELGVEIVESIGPDHGLPLVRVGIDAGPAIERGGDWFGSTVNRAARLVDLAEDATVLITERVHELSSGEESIEFEPRGLVRPRGFAGRVEVYAARRRAGFGPDAHASGPVHRH